MRAAERAVSVGAIVAPWLALAWSPPTLLASLFGALVIAAAATHGFGGALAILLDHRAGAPLLLAAPAAPRRAAVDTLSVGAAIVLLLGGALAALGRFDHTGQLATIITGLVLHSLAIAHHHREADLVARGRAALARAEVAGALLWLVLLALLGLHVLGLFASQHGPAYDDDGHWFAAAKRLRDTGGFADPIGYGRAYQLGGSVLSSVFAATVGDVRCTRLGEVLGFILTFLGLAQLALSPRDRRAAGAMIFLLLALALSSKAQAEFDTSLFWLPCALFIATFRHLLARARAPARGDGVWLAILLAGLCAIRLEYLPFALALTIVAPGVRRLERARQAATLVGGIAVLLAPLAIDWHAGGAATRLVARVLPVAVSVAVCGGVLMLPRRPRTPIAMFTYAIAVTAAISFAVPTPAGEFSQRVTWAPIFALLYVSLAALAQTQWAPREELAQLQYVGGARFRFTTAAILVLSTVAFIMRAQDPTVRMSWRFRFRTWIEDASELALGRPTPRPFAPYAQLLQQVPRGTTVLTWLDHPERLDDRDHELLDLRVPRHRDLRTFSWGLRPSPLPGLVRTTRARYLLVEGDLLQHRRARDSLLFELWCTPWNESADPVLGRPAICADALEQALVGHRIVATVDGVTLIDLAEPRT